MYVWIGIDVDDQLTSVKARTQEVERRIGFEHSNFTLPLHVSLKISFRVEESARGEVIDTILQYYKGIEPFEIEVSGIEREGGIVWIRYRESETLNRIHDDLNRILLEGYGVPLHAYDLDYKFHTTLFMDDDAEKLAAAHREIREMTLPERVRVKALLLGTSESGALGSFRVVHRVLI